jgi:hypothetical protein
VRQPHTIHRAPPLSPMTSLSRSPVELCGNGMSYSYN